MSLEQDRERVEFGSQHTLLRKFLAWEQEMAGKESVGGNRGIFKGVHLAFWVFYFVYLRGQLQKSPMPYI